MNDRHESPLSRIAEEKYAISYGVHRWSLKDKNIKLLTAVSANNWTDYTERLEGILPIDRLIVSPELITCTEIASANVSESRELIESRIEQMRMFSKSFLEATIVLGTAIFGEEEKPKNGALFIKNGEIIGQTAKRSRVTSWENENFTFDTEEKAVLIPGTSFEVLICSDLPLASLYSRPVEHLDEVLTRSGHDNFIGHKPDFINKEAKGLISLNCWGIGANEYFFRMYETSPDEYYRIQFRNSSRLVFIKNPNIDEIAAIDRVPNVDENYKGTISSKPINAFFSRK